MQLVGLHALCLCVCVCACVCYNWFVPLQCCQSVADKGWVAESSYPALHHSVITLLWQYVGSKSETNATRIYANSKDSPFQPIRHKESHTHRQDTHINLAPSNASGKLRDHSSLILYKAVMWTVWYQEAASRLGSWKFKFGYILAKYVNWKWNIELSPPSPSRCLWGKGTEPPSSSYVSIDSVFYLKGILRIK